MELQAAFDVTMRAIKAEDRIPDQYHGFLHPHLRRMYVAGYDQRGREFVGHNQCPVTLLDRNRHPLGNYPNIRHAARRTHYATQTIRDSLRSEEATHRGEFWVHCTDNNAVYCSPLVAPVTGNHHTPVGCYDKQGHFVNDYPSIRLAAEVHQCSVLVIQRSIRLKRYTRQGLLWRRSNEQPGVKV